MLLIAYFRANLRAALEYRASFVSELLAMLINDVMWLTFWMAFYARYPAVAGWGPRDVGTLWAVCTTSFGVAWVVFGGSPQLAGMIRRGELDFFLTLPRPVLFHALISRMTLSAWGDVVFGVAAFMLVAQPSAADCGLFVLLVASNAGLVVGFAVLVSSLAFFIEDAEGPVQLIINMLMSISSQPTPIFRGAVRMALFSAVPAAFIGFVPVELLRTHRSSWLLLHVSVAGAFVALGAWTFMRGLRRHVSGSLFSARV